VVTENGIVTNSRGKLEAGPIHKHPLPSGPKVQGLLNIGVALEDHPFPMVPSLKLLVIKYRSQPPVELKSTGFPLHIYTVSLLILFAVAVILHWEYAKFTKRNNNV